MNSLTVAATYEKGAKLGPYEILGLLGRGGMGKVYRALDPRLGREVALKLLPNELFHNHERRRRFEREARSLAAFHHPGIVTLYGFEEIDGILCLIMELVEGPTLADRLKHGSLPLPEALRIASQIAEALEAAHERSILHRDLKPSNIKITPEGHVKLIDFGLAKMEPEESEAEQSEKPTASEETTGFGVAVGTAPYMSPEQARAEPVDHRTDVWAFGCVLYEMLTGRRVFPGKNSVETIAAVLRMEPDWNALPAETPSDIRKLLKRTLIKEKAHRLHDIGDAQLELEEAAAELISDTVTEVAPPRTVRPQSRAWVWTIGLLLVAFVIGLVVWLFLRGGNTNTPGVTRLTFAPPAGVKIAAATGVGFSGQKVALSPHGTPVVFVGLEGEVRRLYVQAINELEAHPIPNTEGADTPFFSPDGLWLGYAQGKQLKKVPINGGSALPIADLPNDNDRVRGASWGENGTIVFSPGPPDNGLWKVSAEGGKPQKLTTPDRSKGESNHRWPQILPGGKFVLFTILRGRLISSACVGLLSLENGHWQILLEKTGFARYSPTGHIIFARLGSLYVQPFNLSSGGLSGSAVPAVDDVQMDEEAHFYSEMDVSASGALLYAPGFVGKIDRYLLWVDRQGRTQPATAARQAYYGYPRLSPDGRQASITIRRDPETEDVWVLDLETESKRRVATEAYAGEWSPDGESLTAATKAEAGDLLVRITADGTSPLKVLSPPLNNMEPDSWSADGQTIVFTFESKNAAGHDIGTLPAGGGKPSALLATPYAECAPTLSPDGRYMAYTSNESGFYEIYVIPFPGPIEKKYKVSVNGGFQPRFSRDGRELFYRSLGDRPKLMSVPIDLSGAFQAGAPQPLFDDKFADAVPGYPTAYDVSSDGKRFLFIEEPTSAPGPTIPTRLVLIPDWSRELRAKLRTARP